MNFVVKVVRDVGVVGVVWVLRTKMSKKQELYPLLDHAAARLVYLKSLTCHLWQLWHFWPAVDHRMLRWWTHRRVTWHRQPRSRWDPAEISPSPLASLWKENQERGITCTQKKTVLSIWAKVHHFYHFFTLDHWSQHLGRFGTPSLRIRPLVTE